MTDSPRVDSQPACEGEHAVLGVPTAVAGFVGHTERGPVDEPIEVTGLQEFDSVFGGGQAPSPVRTAAADFFANGGSRALIVRVHSGARSAVFSLPTVGGAWRLRAIGPGAWANGLVIRVDEDSYRRPDRFHLRVRDPGSGLDEQYLEVSIDEGSPWFVGHVLSMRSRLLRLDVLSVSGPPSLPEPVVFAAGQDVGALHGCDLVQRGEEGGALDASAFGAAGACAEPDTPRRGLAVLDAAPDLGLLYVPPPAPGVDVDESVLRFALELCARQGAMLLLDPPRTWVDAASVLAGLSALPRAADAAVFFPPLGEPGGESGKRTTRGPAAAVAGLLARGDELAGIWTPPGGANATLRGTGRPACELQAAELQQLTAAGVNCLRALPPLGAQRTAPDGEPAAPSTAGDTVLWGARTLADGDDVEWVDRSIAWRRVRRWVERSLQRGLTWTAGRPGGRPLHDAVEHATREFLARLWKRGGLAGENETEAFRVCCAAAGPGPGLTLVVGLALVDPSAFVDVTLTLRCAPPD